MIESLKKLLTSEISETIKDVIKKQKKEIEKGYQEKDRVNEDFLFTMLSKGYLDEDYRYYIADSYDSKFEFDERFYINNVKDDLEPQFALKIKQYESVIKEIRDYQWSSPSVLNNDVLTYLIKQKLSNQINWFINAIQNYHENYGKNDFIDQYVEKISSRIDKNEIITFFIFELSKKLKSDLSIETKNKILLSIFSEKAGSLFCELFSEQSEDFVNQKNLWNSFFKKRQSILEYVVLASEHNAFLKKNLDNINVEAERLSDYNDKAQELLLRNGMLQISKYNLDYLIGQQENIRPYFYYDCLRKYPKLKNKLTDSARLNDFIENLLLNEKKICFSSEGIVDFLFTTPVDDVMTELISQRMDDEIVDLTFLPKFFSDIENLFLILSLNSTKIHTLIEWNKIKIDFNNLLYISHNDFVDDIILFAKKQINRDRASLQLFNINDIARRKLDHFYKFLFTENKVDNELFENELVFLIKNNIDVVNLATFVIEDGKNVSDEKMQIFIRLIFGRPAKNEKSNKTFCIIIRRKIEYFLNNFEDIVKKHRGKRWLYQNLSILLKNEYKILEEYFLDRIMERMSIEDFEGVVKEMCDDIGYIESSKIVKRRLKTSCLEVWKKKFGKERIETFVKLMKVYMTEDLVNELMNRIRFL